MAPKKKPRLEGDGSVDKSKIPPYLWQWQDEDGAWKAFQPSDQSLLQAEFTSKPKPPAQWTTGAMSFSNNNNVTFDFQNGKQINEETKKVRLIRRLIPGTWEFKDDDGTFVAFYDDDNSLIESAWRALPNGEGECRSKALSWNAGYDSQYCFTFKTDTTQPHSLTPNIRATQKNEDSGTVRELRRTQPFGPAAWDTTSYGIAGVKPLKESELLTKAKADAAAEEGAGAQAAAAVDISLFNPPPYWEPQTKPFQLFNVSKDSEEFKRVTTPFLDTLKMKSVTIHGLQRIQNEALWRFYVLKRFHVALRNGGNPHEECFLFHGARVRENMNAIMEFGFDLRVARDGLAGVGIYFATNSSYSNGGYVIQNPDGSKEMFICRVALGSTAEGKHGMKKPPARKKVAKKQLTAGVLAEDDLADSVHRGKPPIMHVVFDNAQAYPEYLLHYTAKWT
jgi:hypothetical protein